MLSVHSETFDTDGLKETSINSRQIRVSVDNDEFGARRVPQYLTSEDDPEQEKEMFVSDDALGSSSFTAIMMESQWDRDGVHSELSHAGPEMRTLYAQSAQATRKLIESSEHVDGGSKPARPFYPPSIVVSDSADNEFADGFISKLFKSCSSTPSHTSLEGIQGSVVQHSCMSMAPFRQDTRPRSLYGRLPTNYELATQDRRCPDIPIDIESKSETSAFDSLRAFCIDADSTMTDNAAPYYLATNSSHAKRRRLSREHLGLQTPADGIRSSKQRQELMFAPPDSSSVQSFTYPTPTLSFESLSTDQHSDSDICREDTPSVQTPLSCKDPNEPLSPASPSPSILRKTDDSIARCLKCPNVKFEGSNRKNSLRRHERDQHNGKSRLKCLVPECIEDFAPGRKDNLMRHVKATHPGFPLPASTTKRKRKPGSV